VTWSSSATSVATISNANGSQGVATATGLGVTTITATLGSVVGSDPLRVKTLTALAVSPTTTAICPNASIPFYVQGTFSDGSKQYLTTSVSWTSSDTSVATISINYSNLSAPAAAIAVGTTTITAQAGSVTSSGTLNVKALNYVIISPPNPTLLPGGTQQFSATAKFTDGTSQGITSSANWTSANPSVATVGNTTGVYGFAQAVSGGSSKISATLAGSTASTTLTVKTLSSITVNPATSQVAVGLTTPFTATGNYSDGTQADITTSVQWSSAPTSVATISNTAGSQGVATGVSQGTATITATSGSISGTASLTVNPPASLVSIALNPNNPTLPAGVTRQMQAIGTYSDNSTQDITTSVTWSSSLTSVATISNASGSQGVITSVSLGNSTITAVQGSISASTTLRVKTLSTLVVSPNGSTVPKGSNLQLYAFATFTDGSTQYLTTSVNWASSVTTVASVNSLGIAAAAGAGTTVVTATSGSVSGSANVTVKLLSSITVYPNNVYPNTLILPVGGTTKLTATATYTDLTQSSITGAVQWSTSAASVVTVGSNIGTYGVTNAVSAGSANVTATVGSISGSATVIVKAPQSIAVTPPNATVGNGMQKQYVATASYSDSTTEDISGYATWRSDTPAVATINTLGLSTAVAAGQANISAQVGTTAGTTTLTVKTFSSLQISPGSATLAASAQQTFTATANYTDSTQEDLTQVVSWTSDNANVASVSNGPANQGIATGLTVGSANIKATAGGSGVSAQAPVTVTSTGLGNVKHIMFFLQENRSLDTYFGMMGQYRINKGITNDNPVFNGLPLSVKIPGKTGDQITPFPLKTVCMENLTANWDAVHLDVDNGQMDQFLVNALPSTFDPDGTRPIGYYDWNDLPYYYELAFQFATSDNYFSAALAPTVPNRMYMFAATSQGNVLDSLNPPPGGYTMPTIFSLLDKAGISWRMYYQDSLHINLKSYAIYSTDSAKVVPLSNWSTDVQHESTLPQVIFFERGGNFDEHPGGNVQVGANTAAGIINALLGSPSWPTSIFIEAFDEGGGTYDHVPPVSRPLPDNIPPNLTTGDQPGAFDTTGFRVPLVVLSPWTKPHLVSHTMREHSSILKLIETRFNLPSMTMRDATADNMTEFFDFSSPQWLTPPTLPVQPTNGQCLWSQETGP
jgi:phospholipase C